MAVLVGEELDIYDAAVFCLGGAPVVVLSNGFDGLMFLFLNFLAPGLSIYGDQCRMGRYLVRFNCYGELKRSNALSWISIELVICFVGPYSDFFGTQCFIR